MNSSSVSLGSALVRIAGYKQSLGMAKEGFWGVTIPVFLQVETLTVVPVSTCPLQESSSWYLSLPLEVPVHFILITMPE